MRTIFKTGETAKRNDTGEHVEVIEVIPVGMEVAYRIEYENGDRSIVFGAMLRPVQLIAARGR